MTRTKKAQVSRVGPTQLMGMYESQFDMLNGPPLPYLCSLILPEINEPRRVPDEVTATSAVFKSPQVIENLPFSGSWSSEQSKTLARAATDPGETTVMLFPSVFGCVWHTLGRTVLLPPTLTGVALRPTLRASETTVIANDGQSYISHALRTNQVGVMPRLNSQGIPVYEISIISDDTDTHAYGVTVFSMKAMGSTFKATVRVWARVAGAPGFGSSIHIVDIESGTGYFSVPMAADIELDALYISIAEEGASSDDWTFSIGADITTGSDDTPTFGLDANSSTAYAIRDIDQLTNLSLTSNIRPAALSGLVTWMGSTLENGGNIAVARLPAGQTLSVAPRGDYYGFISQLPVYNADYPLKDGAYAWWCPDSEQEYFFRNYHHFRCDNLNEVSSLVFTLRRDEPAQTVRLRVDANFEALTRSVQYTSEVSVTSVEFPHMLEVAKTMPAVSINKAHEAFFSRLFKRAKNWMSKPSNWTKLLRGGAKLLTGI
jgi:hypothetical protein